jgi:phytoene desaturase
MHRHHAIIVGAGVAGLSAAAHLASAGLRVTVLEMNRRPGGRCARIERDGHTFDIGPTLYVMPRLYDLEFAALGERLHDRLTLRRVDPTYRLHFDDGSTFDLTSDPERMRRQMEAIEPGSYARLQPYLEEGGRHYGLLIDRVARRNFRTLREHVTPSNLLLALQMHAHQSHYQRVGAFFRTERLKNIFSFQDMYVGISPFQGRATLSMMQHSELVEGVWYPEGGMSRIADILYDMALERGVEVRLESPVAEIEIASERAVGVRLADGSRVAADVVIANADLPYVYHELLPDPAAAQRLERRAYSCSTISFLWGLDREVPEVPAHALFLSGDFRACFDAILVRKTIPAHPTVYLHAPARLDRAMAPAGMDTLLAIVPICHLDPSAGQDWQAFRQRARQAAVRRAESLGVSDLESHLRFEICIDPFDWLHRFNLMRGATHGLAHTLLQMGYFRPHNRHDRYPNLYFAGASTHPGTGLPTAMASGRLAAERVMEDLPRAA